MLQLLLVRLLWRGRSAGNLTVTLMIRMCCTRQVVNKTMLRLNVGERSALSKGLRLLATLGPDADFRLPVLRAETGLMCFQPAGALPVVAHRPQHQPHMQLIAK